MDNELKRRIKTEIISTTTKGGPGSGNWGHAGILGQWGGSAPTTLGKPYSQFSIGKRGQFATMHRQIKRALNTPLGTFDPRKETKYMNMIWFNNMVAKIENGNITQDEINELKHNQTKSLDMANNPQFSQEIRDKQAWGAKMYGIMAEGATQKKVWSATLPVPKQPKPQAPVIAAQPAPVKPAGPKITARDQARIDKIEVKEYPNVEEWAKQVAAKGRNMSEYAIVVRNDGTVLDSDHWSMRYHTLLYSTEVLKNPDKFDASTKKMARHAIDKWVIEDEEIERRVMTRLGGFSIRTAPMGWGGTEGFTFKNEDSVLSSISPQEARQAWRRIGGAVKRAYSRGFFKLPGKSEIRIQGPHTDVRLSLSQIDSLDRLDVIDDSPWNFQVEPSFKEKRLKGGPGSGNHGHRGIPGHHGGSAPGNGRKTPAPATATDNQSLTRQYGNGKGWVTTDDRMFDVHGSVEISNDGQATSGPGEPLNTHGRFAWNYWKDLGITPEAKRRAGTGIDMIVAALDAGNIRVDYDCNPQRRWEEINMHVARLNKSTLRRIQSLFDKGLLKVRDHHNTSIMIADETEAWNFVRTNYSELMRASNVGKDMVTGNWELKERRENLADILKSLLHARLKGGPGSGNFGHAGRPGHLGGSAPDRANTLEDVPEALRVVSNTAELANPRNFPNYYNGDPDRKAFITKDDQVFDVRGSGTEPESFFDSAPCPTHGIFAQVYWKQLGIPEEVANGSGFYGIQPIDEAIKAGNIRFNWNGRDSYDMHVDTLDRSAIRRLQDLIDRNVIVVPAAKRRVSYLNIQDLSGERNVFTTISDLMKAEGVRHNPLSQNAYEWELVVKETRLKGGPGSGHFGHAGIPGHLGGSADDDGGGKKPESDSAEARVNKKPVPQADTFDKKKWHAMTMDERRKAWGELSVADRDRMANAAVSIRDNQADLLKDLPERPDSGDLGKDIGERVKQAKDYLAADGGEKIQGTAEEFHSVLSQIDMPEADRRALVMEATDALIAQEHETYARQLGDHGITHIRNDIETAAQVLKAMPGEDTAEDLAQVYTASIFHDTGYLTEPSRALMDEGHPRWSGEHYDENIRPIVEKTLGKRAAGQISTMIRTHSDSSMDWSNDPLNSVVRLADNTSVFHGEKLPALFKLVPDNIPVLDDLYSGKISVAQAQTKLLANMQQIGDFSPKVISQLKKAVAEVGGMTPKFTLGMLGGEVEGISWHKDHPLFTLRRNKKYDHLHSMLDLGQRQFKKWAESFKADPDDFLTKRRMTVSNPNTGSDVFETVLAASSTKEVARIIKTDLYLRWLMDQRLQKHLGGSK